MHVTGRWNGRIFGTHTGNVSLKFLDDHSGVIRINESAGGHILIYDFRSQDDGNRILIDAVPRQEREEQSLPGLSIAGQVVDDELEGDWEASSGAGGTFILYPHDKTKEVLEASDHPPQQLHEKKKFFGAVKLGRQDIIKICDQVQREFKSNVAIMYGEDLNRIMYLNQFRNTSFGLKRVLSFAVNVAEIGDDGLRRSVVIEFNQQANSISVQGPDEIWVQGLSESLSNLILTLEDKTVTRIKKYTVEVNSVVFALSIALVVGVPEVVDRLIFMFCVLGLIATVNICNLKFIHYTNISLSSNQGSIADYLVSKFYHGLGKILFAAANTAIGVFIVWFLNRYYLLG